MAGTICKSCGEPNYEGTTRCWKCGVQMNCAVRSDDTGDSNIGPGSDPRIVAAHLDFIRAMSGQTPGALSWMLAFLPALLIGMAASVFSNIPFLIWVYASSLPLSMAFPFVIWMTIAGAVAGVLATIFRPRWHYASSYLFMYLVFTILLMMISITELPVSRIILSPPSMGHGGGFFGQYLYQLCAGYFVTCTVLVGLHVVRNVVRARISPVTLPVAYSWRSQAGPRVIDNRSRIPTFYVVALCVCTVMLLWLFIDFYVPAIRIAAHDPSPVVMAYLSLATHDEGSEPGRIDYFLTRELADRAAGDPKIATMLEPQRKLAEHFMPVFDYGRTPVPTAFGPEGNSAGVFLPIGDDGSIHQGGYASARTISYLNFYLVREHGRWKIADPPREVSAQPGR